MSLDVTKEDWDRDDWPAIWDRARTADILIIGTPIWLGEVSSNCRTLIERLYAVSDDLNEKGQGINYNQDGGVVVTGNEDGVKHVSISVLFALQHIGCTIPPQADCGWIGEAGPRPSYGDDTKGTPVGFDNDFTQQSTTTMAWNLMHMAKLLKDAGGLPNTGNDRNAWKAGERFG